MTDSGVTRKNPNAILGARRQVLELAAREVHVGWSIKMDASPETVAKAVFNTLGTDTIPERDAITPTVISQLDRIREATIAALRSRDPQAALARLAEEIEVEFKRTVSAFSDPPNAPSTVAAKGRQDPLVDTGQMLDQATARVVRK